MKIKEENKNKLKFQSIRLIPNWTWADPLLKLYTNQGYFSLLTECSIAGRSASVLTIAFICLKSVLADSLLATRICLRSFKWLRNRAVWVSSPSSGIPSKLSWLLSCHWRSWNECRLQNESKWFLRRIRPRSIVEKCWSRNSKAFFSVLKILQDKT